MLVESYCHVYEGSGYTNDFCHKNDVYKRDK